MDMIYSDSTPEEFKAKVSQAVDEAKANGTAEVKDDKNHLNLVESNGDVLIEDKKNGNEVTKVKEQDGKYTMEGVVPATKTQSATLPDVAIEDTPADRKDKVEKPGSTEPNVTVSIEESITDKDKAGVDKHYSLTFNGFESIEEAQAFYSDLAYASESLTFSEEEVADVAKEANEAKELQERVEGTKDPKLAEELKDKAETLKAYSVLASEAGYEMGDLYEMASIYSDYADEVLTQVYSEMDVNEYFSAMDEDEINAYFSGLDEVEAEVLYSALQDEDNYTFSDVEYLIDATYSELELDQEADVLFSELSEDEANEFFSQFTDQELNCMQTILESNPNATFSEINEAFEVLNTPMNEFFSDFTEEDLAIFSEDCGEENAAIAFSMAVDENENYTYSDFLDVVEYMNTYSEEDVEQLKSNAEEIKKAAEEMETSKDAELAKKVKVLADDTVEEVEKAEQAGCEGLGETKAKCQAYSESAVKILEEKGIKPEDVDKNEVINNIMDESTKEGKEAKAGKTVEKKVEDTKKDDTKKPAVNDPKPADNPGEDTKKEDVTPKSFSYLFGDTENRTFSEGNEGEKLFSEGNKPSNSNISSCFHKF
jgi:hypothetical protein